MEYSKLNDLDAVRVCLEIMRPHCAASAYRTGAEYLTADLERCGLSGNSRAHITLHLVAAAPEAAQCPIYGLQLANYCTRHHHPLRNLWEWLRAFYHAYGYAMQMAIARLDTAEAAANWLENWHARWECVQQPIEDAAALLLERRDLTPEERRGIELVQAHCSLYSECTIGSNFNIEHKHRHTAEEDAPEILASLVDREAIASALENLTKPQRKRATAPVQFSDIVTAKAKDKAALLKWLHTQIDGKGGAFVAAHIIALHDAKYITTKNPTKKAFCAEFPECRKWESIAKYLQPMHPPKRPSPSDIYIPADI